MQLRIKEDVAAIRHIQAMVVIARAAALQLLVTPPIPAALPCSLQSFNRITGERVQGRLNQKQKSRRTKTGITGPASEYASAPQRSLQRSAKAEVTVQYSTASGLRRNSDGSQRQIHSSIAPPRTSPAFFTLHCIA